MLSNAQHQDELQQNKKLRVSARAILVVTTVVLVVIEPAVVAILVVISQHAGSSLAVAVLSKETSEHDVLLQESTCCFHVCSWRCISIVDGLVTGGKIR